MRVFPSALLLTTSIVASSSCATTQPNPDFKMATAVEYFDCSPTDPSCPARGTPHVAIDPGRFRRSLARAVFVDWKTWSKGSSLLRVRLPDGRTQNYASRWGQPAIESPASAGCWIFRNGEEKEFESLLAAANRALRVTLSTPRGGRPPQGADAAPPFPQ